ncbi:hypothetical protein [Streptomyces atratus]
MQAGLTGHIVAKLEKEQAGGHYPPRLEAAGPVTGRRRTDQTAALKLLRTAFPVLPSDTASGPDTVPATVEEQRRARAVISRGFTVPLPQDANRSGYQHVSVRQA